MATNLKFLYLKKNIVFLIIEKKVLIGRRGDPIIKNIVFLIIEKKVLIGRRGDPIIKNTVFLIIGKIC